MSGTLNAAAKFGDTTWKRWYAPSSGRANLPALGFGSSPTPAREDNMHKRLRSGLADCSPAPMIPSISGTKIFRAAARGILFVSLTASMVLGARRDLEAQEADAKALIAKVVEEAGGEGALREKRDVGYPYLYRRAGTGAVDFMMEVEYERVDGVLLPTKRRYTQSDWSGNVPKDAEWTDEISIGIRFNNGFEPPLFQAHQSFLRGRSRGR
jgi:hypothetical protein